MPLNRTNQKIQARTPGMVITTGTLTLGASGAITNHEGDPGVLATKTGTGTYDISLPASGVLDVRDAQAFCSNEDAFTYREWSVDGRTLSISTFDGGPGTGSPTYNVVGMPFSEVTGTLTNGLFYTFPTDATVTDVGYAPSVDVTTPATPGDGFVISARKHIYGGSNISMSVNLAVGNLTPGVDTITSIDQFDGEFLYFTPLEPGATIRQFSRGDSILISVAQLATPVTMPEGVVTFRYYEGHGSGTAGGTGTPTDFSNTTLSYTIWVKNSSAR